MKAQFKMDVKGFERFLQSQVTAVGDIATKQVTESTNRIYNESQVECPVDTGTLKSSGERKVERTNKGVEGIVRYGGKGDPVNPATGKRASEYAVEVHEDLFVNHPQGKAKFLEDPTRREQVRFDKNLAQKMRARRRR